MKLNNLVRANIKNLLPYSSARDEFNSSSDKMVFIDANENPYNNGLNRYPDPQQSLVKEKLAGLKGVEKNQILLGNGSDEVLDLLFRVFCEPSKDAVIALPPTYGMYKVLANINNVQLIEIPLTNDFQPNKEQILKAINPNTKLLFLCSPNNPTANSLDASIVEELIINFNGIVVIDEAYIDFSKQESWLSKLNQFPNLVVTQTFSKAFGLAGIRLGVCYASKEIISLLNKVKPPYNVNELTQQKALTSLQNINKVEEQIQQIIQERNSMMSKLQEISCVEKVFSSDANFLLVKVDNANKRYEQLIKKGIVVRNRSNQILCENCLRFTVGTPKENTQLINTLKAL